MTIYMKASREKAAEHFRDTTTRVVEIFRSTNWHSDQESQDTLRHQLPIFLARGEEAKILAACVPRHRRGDLEELIRQTMVGHMPTYDYKKRAWVAGDVAIPYHEGEFAIFWQETHPSTVDDDTLAVWRGRIVARLVVEGLYAKVG